MFDIPATSGRPRFASAFSPSPRPLDAFVPRFSAAGDAILSFTGRKELSWLDATSGRVTGPGKVALALEDPEAIAVSPDGRWFAAGGYYGPQLFPVDRGAGTPRLFAHTNGVNSCEFSPDSTLLLSSSWDRTVRLWLVREGEPVGAPLHHEQIVQGARLCPTAGTWPPGNWAGWCASGGFPPPTG